MLDAVLVLFPVFDNKVRTRKIKQGRFAFHPIPNPLENEMVENNLVVRE